MTVIEREILQLANGYWWAWSQTKLNRCYSLHTRDKDKAQAIYEQHLANARRAFDEADAGMEGVQERYR